MTDRLKTVYPPKTSFCGGYNKTSFCGGYKKKDKSNLQNHIFFSVIELVILNMHIKFKVSNCYTD